MQNPFGPRRWDHELESPVDNDPLGVDDAETGNPFPPRQEEPANPFLPNALFEAAKAGDAEVCHHILTGQQRNDDDHIDGEPGIQLLPRLLPQSSHLLHTVDDVGNTPFVQACARGHYEIASLLLHFGADINYANNPGNTSLHCATSNGRENIVCFLLENHAEVDPRNIRQETPLMIASDEGHTDILTLLVSYGAAIHARDIDDQTALLRVETESNLPPLADTPPRTQSEEDRAEARCALTEERSRSRHVRRAGLLPCLLGTTRQSTARPVTDKYQAAAHAEHRVAMMVVDDDASASAADDRPLVPPPFAPTKYFGTDLRRYTQNAATAPDFSDRILRQVMEPHIQKARQARTRALASTHHPGDDPTTPAVLLEQVVYSQASFPMRQSLARLLQVDDLGELHTLTHAADKRALLAPLVNSAESRKPFVQAYQDFVLDCILPHVVRRAWSNTNDDDDANSSNEILVRYQAFPCLRVVRPGDFSIGPHCDAAYGHTSIDSARNVHVPLTGGTNDKSGSASCLFLESAPGREDWQPLVPPSLDDHPDEGRAYLWLGARCLHFTLENTTAATRVSLDFRFSTSSATDTSRHAWEDRYSSPPGYYALARARRTSDGRIAVTPLPSTVDARAGNVDKRVGFPFT